VQQLDVRWPSGTHDVYHNIAANTRLLATEGETSQPLAQRPAAQPQLPESDTYTTRVHAGMTAYRAKRYAEAAQAFESAVPLRPMEPLPLRYLADIYWRQGKRDLAAEVVGKLAHAMPDAYYLDRQGNGYEESGLHGLAHLLYVEAVRLRPTFPSARFNLGRSYLEAGDLARGITELQEALRLYPTFAEAHETLGLAYTEQGKYEQALSHLQQAITLHPGLAVSRNHLGRLYLALERFDEAITTFQGLVQRQPAAAAARHNLAIAYARKGAHNEAVAQFRHALQLQPQFHAARFDLGTLLLEIGRPQEAITAFNTIVTAPAEETTASVDRLEARYRLGVAYARAQQQSDAIATFTAVVQAKPDHANAHVYLARLYYEQQQFQRAWQHVQRAEALGAPVAELVSVLQRAAPQRQ
jgi:tetratricopeptide (TPR) repeat protein